MDKISRRMRRKRSVDDSPRSSSYRSSLSAVTPSSKRARKLLVDPSPKELYATERRRESSRKKRQKSSSLVSPDPPSPSRRRRRRKKRYAREDDEEDSMSEDEYSDDEEEERVRITTSSSSKKKLHNVSPSPSPRPGEYDDDDVSSDDHGRNVAGYSDDETTEVSSVGANDATLPKPVAMDELMQLIGDTLDEEQKQKKEKEEAKKRKKKMEFKRSFVDRPIEDMDDGSFGGVNFQAAKVRGGKGHLDLKAGIQITKTPLKPTTSSVEHVREVWNDVVEGESGVRSILSRSAEGMFRGLVGARDMLLTLLGDGEDSPSTTTLAKLDLSKGLLQKQQAILEILQKKDDIVLSLLREEDRTGFVGKILTSNTLLVFLLMIPVLLMGPASIVLQRGFREYVAKPLCESDPQWMELCAKLAKKPWLRGIIEDLPDSMVE